MNWDQIKGDWSQLSVKLKEKWNKLTDSDLRNISGNQLKLAVVLQDRYGFDRDQAYKELDRFTTRLTS
jgi:uncharacterized protein YjbJ (UPF0337 family)